MSNMPDGMAALVNVTHKSQLDAKNATPVNTNDDEDHNSQDEHTVFGSPTCDNLLSPGTTPLIPNNAHHWDVEAVPDTLNPDCLFIVVGDDQCVVIRNNGPAVSSPPTSQMDQEIVKAVPRCSLHNAVQYDVSSKGKMDMEDNESDADVEISIASDAEAHWYDQHFEVADSLAASNEWAILLSNWITIEKDLANSAKSVGRLPSKDHPTALHDWLQHSPKALNDYGNDWWKWWSHCQPSWRIQKSNGKGFIPSDGKRNWSALYIDGNNGLLLHIMCLAWWGNASIGNAVEKKKWTSAVKELSRALEQMYTLHKNES
ncbi:hypothetical protein BS47DRAFT_1365255 [Hydnum rufescens UP504]|uniref:Uncharacterized protein n=1 Tax=Hydnum rufescens UP504 TaxID=1448309 RepID=A0A9P6DPX5_9AGAM|nr:hypothetical protein BS47DRAFT_1365255 [Hydnum rufescens UP504]